MIENGGVEVWPEFQNIYPSARPSERKRLVLTYPTLPKKFG